MRLERQTVSFGGCHLSPKNSPELLLNFFDSCGNDMRVLFIHHGTTPSRIYTERYCGGMFNIAHSRRFDSIASDAASFRSRCDSVRRPPVFSSQRSPGAALHVGQRTDNSCFRVRSLLLIATQCADSRLKDGHYCSRWASPRETPVPPSDKC